MKYTIDDTGIVETLPGSDEEWAFIKSRPRHSGLGPNNLSITKAGRVGLGTELHRDSKYSPLGYRVGFNKVDGYTTTKIALVPVFYSGDSSDMFPVQWGQKGEVGERKYPHLNVPALVDMLGIAIVGKYQPYVNDNTGIITIDLTKKVGR